MRPMMKALLLAVVMVLPGACEMGAEDELSAEEDLPEEESPYEELASTAIVSCEASGVCNCAGFWPWQIEFYDRSAKAEGATLDECCQAGYTDITNQCAALEAETGWDCGFTNIRKQCRRLGNEN